MDEFEKLVELLRQPFNQGQLQACMEAVRMCFNDRHQVIDKFDEPLHFHIHIRTAAKLSEYGIDTIRQLVMCPDDTIDSIVSGSYMNRSILDVRDQFATQLREQG